ncbi:hypothetical protein LSTR_LSTR012040 [Laodelphax striatellus]|uniref:Uncharacterized protein n=1 Tax=Laodelphax striatellus TaxID=195883 RepID=A0A482WR57_LAOST|nr:hypothetical protein LSTR_LSTR012040 [Laodelphax striatellus]
MLTEQRMSGKCSDFSVSSLVKDLKSAASDSEDSPAVVVGGSNWRLDPLPPPPVSAATQQPTVTAQDKLSSRSGNGRQQRERESVTSTINLNKSTTTGQDWTDKLLSLVDCEQAGRQRPGDDSKRKSRSHP